MPGITTSIATTSGCNVAACATASSPFPAPPHNLEALIGCEHRLRGLDEVRIIVDDEKADLLFCSHRSIFPYRDLS